MASRLPLITDVDLVTVPLDSTLFPGVPATILVHMGFAASQSRSAAPILAAVKKTLAAHPKASVTTVGHSLGAALALLDAVYLPLHLPASTKFKTVTYGLPRVGNVAFANYVDEHITFAGGGLTRITNKEDPIPTLPPQILNFRQPSGEVHIEDSNAWDACSGQSYNSTVNAILTSCKIQVKRTHQRCAAMAPSLRCCNTISLTMVDHTAA